MTGVITSIPPLVEQPPGNNSSNPAGLPGITYTFALLQFAQTWTAKQTFPLGNISLNAADIIGLSSVPVLASQLPNPTASTLGGIQSLAAIGSRWINTISTSGVPSATQPAFTDISGSVAATQMPALTGDVTTTAGAVATTISVNAVTNAKAAQMAAKTIKGNSTAGTANASDLTGDTVEQMLLFTQTGTGAVQRSLDSKVKGYWISVKDFGAVGDGIANDTTALQNAINAAQSTNVPLYIDVGTYLITAALNVTAGLTMLGAGRDKSIIKLNSTTQNGIAISTIAIIHFSNFQVQGQPIAAVTAGELISLASGAANPNQFSTFRDLWLQGGFNQIHAVSASGWTIDNCGFFSPKNSGVWIENTTAGDAGDQVITNSTFSGQASTGTAIFQQSAGGTKIIGNKIIQWQRGYWLSLSAGIATSDLFFCGNSMEAFSLSGIELAKGAGTTFGTVVISGNEINGAATPINFGDTTAGWLNNITITGNTIAPDSGTGIVIAAAGYFNIVGNLIQISTGTNTGISIGANASNGNVDGNNFNQITTPIVNNSTTTRITNNRGYNPVGASALSPTASPWTYTVGASPETVFMSGSTNISNVTINGVGIIPAATGAGVNFNVPLGPLDIMVVTYSGTLTAKKMVH